MNGAGEQGLDAAARYVAEALGRVADQEEELKGRLQLAHEERKRLMTALRALAPEHPLVRVKAASKPSKQPGHVSRVNPTTMAKVWAWILEQGDEAFTIQQAIKGIDANSDDPPRRAIYYLRNAEALRLIGKRQVNETGIPSQHFRLLDRDAGERALLENAENFPAAGLRPRG